MTVGLMILVFYSHVICLGTKIVMLGVRVVRLFYSHVICLGTKIIFNCFFRLL